VSTIHKVYNGCSHSGPRNRKNVYNLYRGIRNEELAVGYAVRQTTTHLAISECNQHVSYSNTAQQPREAK
jgi:hypothetical protein